MMVESFCMTTSGTDQRQNHDAYMIDPQANVFLIADGGRNRNSGAQASRSAVAATADTLRQAFRGNRWHWPDFWPAACRDTEKPLHEELLRNAVRHTHLCLKEISRKNRLMEPCRISLIAALIDGTRCQFAQVGLGNLFLFRQGQLQRLIADASLRAPQENRAPKLAHIARTITAEN